MNRRHFSAAPLAVLMMTVAAGPRLALADSDLGSPQRIRHVKAALAITEGQAAPWSDYVAALAAYRSSVREVRAAEIQLMGGAQAVEGDDDAVLRDRKSERFKAKSVLKTRYEALYGALDSAQRHVADATLTAGECGR